MSEVTKNFLIPCILKPVYYRLHRERSMSELDYNAKRVANIYHWVCLGGGGGGGGGWEVMLST